MDKFDFVLPPSSRWGFIENHKKNIVNDIFKVKSFISLET